MPLQKKSELKAINIEFDPAGKLLVRIQWAEGAWDTDTNNWHGSPTYTTQALSEAVNGDKDMTRFTSALGVLHAEVVKQNAALQTALAEKNETVEGQIKHIAELLKTQKLNKAHADGLAQAVDYWRAEFRKRSNWIAPPKRPALYRLTMGFFGR